MQLRRPRPPALQVHEWAAVPKPDGTWTGQIRLQAADYESALKLHMDLRGTPSGPACCGATFRSPTPLLSTMLLGGQAVRAPERPARR